MEAAYLVSSLVLVVVLAAGLRYPGALLAGCLFTYQASSLSYFSWIGLAYIVAAAGITAARHVGHPLRFRVTPVDSALAVFVFYLMASIFWSDDPIVSVGEFARLMQSLGGMYTIARLQRGDPRKLVAEMLVTAVLAGAIFAWAMLAERVTDRAGQEARLWVANENASTVGLSMALPYGMFACIVLLFMARRWLILVGAGAGLLVIGYCSVISATRSVFLSLVVGTVLTVLLLRRQIAPLRLAIAGGALVLGVVAFATFQPADTLASLERITSGFSGDISDPSSRLRVIALGDAYDLFSAHPLLGGGYGSFSLHATGVIYPHNLFAEISSTAGVVGVLLLLIWQLMLARGVLQIGRIDPLAAAVCGGMAAIGFIQMQLSFTFWMARPLFLVTAMTAAFLPRVIRVRRLPAPELASAT